MKLIKFNYFMKRLLAYLFLVLVLTFSLQSWTQADDIREIEVEGMSVDDSLLNFFDINEINKSIKETIQYSQLVPGADKYQMIFFYKNEINLKKYDDITLYFKKNDKKYLISSIGASINFDNKFDECLRKKNTIKKDIENYLNIIFGEDQKSILLDNDESFLEGNVYTSNLDDTIQIACYKWSKEMKRNQNRYDQLVLSINKNEYVNWVQENIN